MKEKKKNEAVEPKTVEDRLSLVEKGMGVLNSMIRRLECRLRDQFGINIDIDGDGKLGSVRIVMAMTLLFLGVAVAFGVTQLATDKANWGVAAIRADGTYVGDAGINVSGSSVLANGKALVCASSTNTLVMDTGDTRITGDGSVTQAFSITFGAAPNVAALYSESGATDILYTASITASNFVLHGTATNAVNWIAVGVR